MYEYDVLYCNQCILLITINEHLLEKLLALLKLGLVEYLRVVNFVLLIFALLFSLLWRELRVLRHLVTQRLPVVVDLFVEQLEKSGRVELEILNVGLLRRARGLEEYRNFGHSLCILYYVIFIKLIKAVKIKLSSTVRPYNV